MAGGRRGRARGSRSRAVVTPRSSAAPYSTRSRGAPSTTTVTVHSSTPTTGACTSATLTPAPVSQCVGNMTLDALLAVVRSAVSDQMSSAVHHPTSSAQSSLHGHPPAHSSMVTWSSQSPLPPISTSVIPPLVPPSCAGMCLVCGGIILYASA